MTLTDLAHNQLVRGAASGVVTAAIVDISNFRAWKTWHDAVVYDWSLASWRWFQGAMMGALTALGWGSVIS